MILFMKEVIGEMEYSHITRIFDQQANNSVYSVVIT